MTATVDTPEGVLLGVLRPGTPEWDAARAGLTITATEIAAVMGLSPWQSRYSLWHKKAGLPTQPFQPNPAMKWGIRLEDDVVEEFTETHPEYLVMETGTWQNKQRPWQRATPDRLLAHRDGDASDGIPIGIFEAKTSPFGDEWGADGTDEVPVYYRAQVIWQQDTLGLYARTPIGVLISGHDYRELYVDYDPDEAALMRKEAAEFLDTVRRGERPPIDEADATYQTVKQQPAGLDDTEVDIGMALAEQYRDLRDEEAKLTARGRRIRALIVDRLGPAKYATHLGERIAYRVANPDGTTRALQPIR